MIKKTNKIAFVMLNMLCVGYCMMYSVPNLVWYFKTSTPLLLNVFFDVVTLALGILGAVTLLSFERVEKSDEAEQVTEKNEAEISDQEPTNDEPIKAEEE